MINMSDLFLKSKESNIVLKRTCFAMSCLFNQQLNLKFAPIELSSTFFVAKIYFRVAVFHLLTKRAKHFFLQQNSQQTSLKT